MHVFRNIRRMAALLGLALAVIGADAAAAQDRVRVASTAREIVDNLALYVALERGFFKDENLAVEISHFAGGGEVVRAIATGSMDIGMVATTAAIIAAGRGEPLKIISAWTAPAYGILFIVPAASPLKTVKDMAGKKVGITRPGSVSHTGLIAAIQATGLQGKVEIIPVGGPGDSWAALKAGRVDASWHTAPDVYTLIDSKEARIFFQTSDFLKDYQQGSLVALDAYVAKNGDAVKRFLRASAKAGAFIQQNPEEAAKIGAKHMNSPEQAMRATLAAMPAGFFKIGAPEQKHFAGSLAEAMGTGSLKEPPAYDKVVDRRNLP
jgi:ABC-type nitrate/sulfonate/bicarbonate transport system substrate-binding protein